MKKLLAMLIALALIAGVGVLKAEAANPATIGVTVTLTLADLSVSLDQTAWPVTASGQTLAVIATNDTTNRTEDFAINCSDGTNGYWTIGATAGPDVFVMTADGGDLSTAPLTVANQTLETDVEALGTVSFTLQFTAPSSTDEPDENMTVEVSAS